MKEREMKTIWSGAVAAALLLLFSIPAGADVAIGARASTLGVGAELTVGLTPQLNGRVGIGGFNYTDERREVSDIEYDAEARLRNATALLDWHPGGRGFRLTAGVVWNGTEVEGNSLPPASGSYDIGGVLVPVEILGTLDAEADFDPVVPYVGLGWGNAVRTDQKLGFSFEIGAMFAGEADIELTPRLPADSPIATNPLARQALQILLDREEADWEEEVAEYDIYPVVSIGLTYKF